MAEASAVIQAMRRANMTQSHYLGRATEPFGIQWYPGHQQAASMAADTDASRTRFNTRHLFVLLKHSVSRWVC